MLLLIKLSKAFAAITLLVLSSVTYVHAVEKPIVIYKRLSLSSSKDGVWSALTEHKELSIWWNKGVQLEPFVGGKFYEPWGEGQLATGKVLKLKKLNSITFTWQEKNWKTFEHTQCTFTLKKLEGATILEVRHSGWETFKNAQKRARIVKAFSQGWDSLLPKLKKYIE